MRQFGPNSDNSGEEESKVGVELKGGFIFQGEGITVSKALSFQRVVTPDIMICTLLERVGLEPSQLVSICTGVTFSDMRIHM